MASCRAFQQIRVPESRDPCYRIARLRTEVGMNPELWRRVEELFQAALDLSPDARPAFLEKACGEEISQIGSSFLQKCPNLSGFSAGDATLHNSKANTRMARKSLIPSVLAC